jgi:aspartate/methionine/tyrosine aminotransferase
MGLPGIRLGWLITKDKTLQELFLAAKEQIWVCNSIVDEEIAYRFLKEKHKFFPPIQKQCKENFVILEKWMREQSSYLEWVKPSGGVVCFPRFRQEIKIDTDLFYSKLYNTYKTLVGPGHWFEQSDRFFRIGYGWPGDKMLTKGLNNIVMAARDSIS